MPGKRLFLLQHLDLPANRFQRAAERCGSEFQATTMLQYPMVILAATHPAARLCLPPRIAGRTEGSREEFAFPGALPEQTIRHFEQ
jgi:hypothetical protein